MKTPRTRAIRYLPAGTLLALVLAACNEQGSIDADVEADTMNGESGTAGNPDIMISSGPCYWLTV